MHPNTVPDTRQPADEFWLVETCH